VGGSGPKGPDFAGGTSGVGAGTNDDSGGRGNVRHRPNPIMRSVAQRTTGPLAAPWRPYPGFGPTVSDGVTNE
jgi:hypothetical protein